MRFLGGGCFSKKRTLSLSVAVLIFYFSGLKIFFHFFEKGIDFSSRFHNGVFTISLLTVFVCFREDGLPFSLLLCLLKFYTKLFRFTRDNHLYNLSHANVREVDGQ